VRYFARGVFEMDEEDGAMLTGGGNFDVSANDGWHVRHFWLSGLHRLFIFNKTNGRTRSIQVQQHFMHL